MFHRTNQCLAFKSPTIKSGEVGEGGEARMREEEKKVAALIHILIAVLELHPPIAVSTKSPSKASLPSILNVISSSPKLTLPWLPPSSSPFLFPKRYRLGPATIRKKA